MDTFGTSPRSSILLEEYFVGSRSTKEQAQLDKDGGDEDDDSKTWTDSEPLSLSEFLNILPARIAHHKDKPPGVGAEKEDGGSPLRRPIQSLLERLVMDAEDWERYALEDPTKNYTRNLVASDGTSYTLLVLVWTPGKSSHVHDHPCDGCWMRVLKGVVRERRYRPSHRENLICCGGKQEEEDRDDGGPRLECFQDGIYREEDKTVVFIEDFLGFHKVENPSSTEPAVTLHLYSPPFDRCRVWIDESSASSASESCCARYDSVHGERMCDGSNTGDNLGLLHPV